MSVVRPVYRWSRISLIPYERSESGNEVHREACRTIMCFQTASKSALFS